MMLQPHKGSSETMTSNTVSRPLELNLAPVFPSTRKTP